MSRWQPWRWVLADVMVRTDPEDTGPAPEHEAHEPLAVLRTDLARDETMPETEDHIAYLCEVMRYLIAGDDVEVANLTQQQKFFTAHVQPWVLQMCDAIEGHPKARFYAALGGFTRAFFHVETQGFDMLV